MQYFFVIIWALLTSTSGIWEFVCECIYVLYFMDLISSNDVLNWTAELIDGKRTDKTLVLSADHIVPSNLVVLRG